MAMDMEKLDIEAMFTTDEEKTFQHDEELPSLPVPTLQHTLDRYLDSVRPHVSDDEYRQTEFICQQFASGIGKDLQKQLLEKAAHTKNWLEKWWFDYAYLDFRLPICPCINFAGPGPYMNTYLPKKEGTQIERAALLSYFGAIFWNNLRKERIKADKDSKGNYMSMNQFRRLYSACRIPGPQRDTLQCYFKPESEGPTPMHIIVMCRGRFFTMSPMDENEVPLTPPELQAQFQLIRDKCDSEPEGPGVGALTGDNRTTWAQVRSHLMALHPDNYRNLETIQRSVMCAIFDDNSPNNEDELCYNGLAGDSTNRWFDKSLTMVFFKNGLAASNCDHSPMDAMTLVVTTYYVDLCVLKCKGQWQGSREVKKLEPPRELVFKLDELIYKSISSAKLVYNQIAKNLQCCTRHFKDYGKKYLRKFKLHPDTHVQMALQYAYYKRHKRPAPTYQTATTRRFYNARTETNRSCTPEAIEWCKAMLDPNTNDATKMALYRRAADKQNTIMTEGTENQGCDRHLMGLQILAIEGGLPMPQIYTDPSYVKSGGGGNFVLSTSFVGYTSVYGGVVPMVENGYGSFYKMDQNTITVFISAWKSSSETDAIKFYETIQECLREMRTFIEGSSTQARM